MMRTFSSGVLGLRAYQTQMDVISNNIANVNNHGFKKGRVLFEDVLSQTMSIGQAPQAALGGINPYQIGLGSKVATVDNIFTQGAMQETGRDIDMAIEGDGFFITTDGNAKYYTRTGAFDIDSSLNLVHSISATKVMGWNATFDKVSKNLSIDTNQPISAINFSNFQKIPAASTTLVEFASNLKLSVNERNFPSEQKLTYFDSQGNLQEVKINFEKVDANTWIWKAYTSSNIQVGTGRLKLDNNGKIIEATDTPIVFDPDGTTGTSAKINLQIPNSANIKSAVIKSVNPPDTNIIKSGIHSLSVTKNPATPHTLISDRVGVSRFNTLAQLGINDVSGFNISVDNQPPITLSGLSVNSTVSDLINAINTQVGGVIAEMQGDRLVIKRALNGPNYNVTVSGNTATALFGPNTITQTGTNESFNITDYFTGSDGTSNVIEYKNVTGDIVIGKSADGTINNGEILISTDQLQPGNATIITHAAYNEGNVTITTPKVGSNIAEFKISSGGTPQNNISVSVTAGDIHTVPMNIYDSTGYNHKMNMEFEKIGPNQWIYRATLSLDDPLIINYFKNNPPQGAKPTPYELYNATATITNSTNSGIIIFDNYGKIDLEKTANANNVQLPKLTKSISFIPIGAEPVSFDLDFNLITQYDSEYSTTVKKSNGYEMGKLNGFLVEESGIIKGVYSNGEKLTIAQLALASFVNNGGLIKKSNNLYIEGANSGKAQIGTAGTGSRGRLLSQNLEMSNVDLASEFTDMIISQRGFQANAKTITTADQMLQEIMALKR